MDDGCASSSGKLVLPALTSNAIEHILAFLNADEINLVLCTSRGLHSLWADEGLWSGLCFRKYGVAGEQALDEYGLRSFSALFAVLSAFVPMQGVYTTLEDYPHGTVVVVRFNGGKLIAESFIPDPIGACARLFEIRFQHEEQSDVIRAVAKCFHHHRPGSRPGHIVGKPAEVRLVPRPGCPIPATGFFAAKVACCSELLLGSAGKGVLEVVFAKGEDQNIYGTWFTAEPGSDMWGGGGEDEVSEEDAELCLAPGRPCKSLAEALNMGTRLLRVKERQRPRQKQRLTHGGRQAETDRQTQEQTDTNTDTQRQTGRGRQSVSHRRRQTQTQMDTVTDRQMQADRLV
jgi:hypothetical protein